MSKNKILFRQQAKQDNTYKGALKMKIVVVLIILNVIGWIIGVLLSRNLINKYKNNCSHKDDHITSIFVTPRLPVTITPDLQYCIKSGVAFILRSEYITTMINSNITEFTIHIPYIDDSDVRYTHRLISTNRNCPALDEVWSEEYIDALNKNISYSMYQNVINELIMTIDSADMNKTDIHELINLANQFKNDIIIPQLEDVVEIQSVLTTELPYDIERAIKLAISHYRKDRRIIVDVFRYPKYRILSQNDESQNQEE